MQILKQKLILIGIIFVALVLRFYQLGQNPPSLTWDEVSWGYNAYSIGVDGKDEFGRFLPYDYLESFGDFKPPAYAYLAVLPVKLFGLNEFATRFPSALFGVLTILITYFLVKRIFFNSKNKEYYALIACAILTVSPWHIMLSRAAFEANVATFLIISGVWLFLGGIQGKKWFLVLSAISFVFSMYTFNTARIVSPILVIILALGHLRDLWARKKDVLIAAFVGFLLLLPTLQFLFSSQASLRFKEVNIFSDLEVIKRTNQDIENDNNAWWSKILHNRRFAYGVEYLKHYFDNTGTSFLFIKGDGNPKFSTQDIGQLYLWELPFLIIGTIVLFRKKEGKWWVVPMWLVVGIIPAATARETPHALRIEAILPTFQILVAYGILFVMQSLKTYKRLVLSFLSLTIVISLSYFLHGYYYHYPHDYSGEWQYGYKESIAYIQEVEHLYDEIIFTTSLGRPYIYFLFYGKVDPREFRKNMDIKRDAFGFVKIEAFGKYRFPEDIHVIRSNKKLYINTARHVPSEAKILKTFNMLNGEPVLAAYTFNE